MFYDLKNRPILITLWAERMSDLVTRDCVANPGAAPTLVSSPLSLKINLESPKSLKFWGHKDTQVLDKHYFNFIPGLLGPNLDPCLDPSYTRWNYESQRTQWAEWQVLHPISAEGFRAAHSWLVDPACCSPRHDITVLPVIFLPVGNIRNTHSTIRKLFPWVMTLSFRLVFILCVLTQSSLSTVWCFHLFVCLFSLIKPLYLGNQIVPSLIVYFIGKGRITAGESPRLRATIF